MKASLLAVAALAALTVGCTTWDGKRENEEQIKRVVLEANNFRILKSGLQAEASCQYLFPSKGLRLMGVQLIPPGGIPLGNPDLYARAYESLRQQADLVGKSAQLYDVTEELTLSNYIVIGNLKVVLTGDVIEFTGPYVDYASR